MSQRTIAQSFTKSVANDLQSKLEHLIGLPFTNSGDLNQTVFEVLVVPWDDLNKWIFQVHYSQSDFRQAIDAYTGHYFDVAVISREKEIPYRMILKDIRTYLLEMGMGAELEMIRDYFIWLHAVKQITGNNSGGFSVLNL